MAHSVEMPELGESVTEGTVTQWLKQVGDKVEVDEPLLEVSTDKVDTEIPSPVAGILLEIIADEDDTVDVGAVIAKIGDEDEAGSDSSDDSDSDDDEDSSEEAAEAESEDESADEDEDSSEDDSAEAEVSESGSGEGEDVVMPELGESVTEGTITQWLKQPGDKVEVDEPLLEVSTDKVDTEIPSPVAGTLVEILANEDDTVDVGDVIARIGDGSAKASKSEDKKSEDKAEKKEEKAEEPAQSEEPAKSEEQAESNDDSDEQESSSDSDSADSDSADSGSGEAEDVVMPELGESVTEGTITQWLKQPGDKVEVDEPLLEVSTDKVDTEIPSPVAGTLVEILANEDDTVDVGDVIARIGDGSAKAFKSESKSEDKAEKKTEQSDETEESVPDESTEIKESSSEDKSGEAKKEDAREKAAEKAKEVAAEEEAKNNSAAKSAAPGKSSSDNQPGADSLPYVTPLVRKLADKHGVDLSQVSGTGVGGRIRKQDVLAAANGESAGEAQSGKSEAPASRNSTFKVDAKKAELRGTTQRVNRIREITAAKTLESLQSTAQLTQVHEVDMTRVAELRSKSKEAFQDKHGVKLTYLPFFAKAMVEALVDHPNVNASYDAQSKEMTYHGQVNLGIAVDTEAGLLSPVIHDAQDLSLPELAKAIVDIADRARNKKLKPTDLTGGTFTITNIGSEGALTDTPILVPPQAAMVGTGAIVQRPIVLTEDGAAAIAIRHMVLLPMTYDHQVIDGADAGRFLSTVRDRLETGDFEADLEL